jgi:hypothetical protein
MAGQREKSLIVSAPHWPAMLCGCAHMNSRSARSKGLINAIHRRVDAQIVYHATPENKKSIKKSGLPENNGGKEILFERTRRLLESFCALDFAPGPCPKIQVTGRRDRCPNSQKL